MTGYIPKNGDRVRVVLEGTVRRTNRNGWLDVGYGAATSALYEPEVTIERLPDPEPEWQPGDVVLAADGKTYLRSNHDWDDEPWVCSEARIASPWRAEGELPRPLTLLVRDGKQVQP